jgi:hypothetical protein
MSKRVSKTFLRVVEEATDKVEVDLDVTDKTARQVDKLFSGLSKCLNRDKYIVVIVGHSQEVQEVDAQYPGSYTSVTR